MKKNTTINEFSALKKKQKRGYFSLFVLLFSLTLSAQSTLSTAENYVYTKSCLDADCVKKAETVQYFDGLGRPVQTVAINATPQGKDIVSPVEYNALGKQVKNYLPIPQQTSGGAFYQAPFANVSNVYGSEKIYSEKVYDNVYTDRIKKMIPVGEAWAQKSVDMGYDTNANGEVRKYTVTTDNWIEGRTDSKITLSGTYAANQLMKTSVTDEDGNTTTEFQNGEGQTILVRKNDGERNVDTYYLYNEFGQLAYVIPPLAVADTASDLTILNSLCYQYRYDGMGRTVEKKLPGKGWEFIVYDKQDRVVAVQDAMMRNNGQWLYTKYDRFGRVAFTGISTGGERSAEQGDADTYGSNNVTRTSSVFFNREGMDVYYDPTGTYPGVGWVKLLSVNYYDTYPAYSFNPAFPGTILGEPIITDAQNASVNTLAMPTLSLVKNIEDDNWTKSYLYYDGKGRIVGTYSINYLGGYTKTESELDFGGITKQTKVYHKRQNIDTERVISQTFEYDNLNRLKKQWHQVDGRASELMAENTYNELSQLSNKKVGNNLQSINYTYNVRGSLIKVNDPANLGTQLFGYEVKYQNPQNTSVSVGKYNGNISEVIWKTASDHIVRQYNYQYDALNRLKKGTYSEPGASVPQNGLFNETVAYDVNSNITSLQRNGKSVSSSAQLIDNLTYNYRGNRLNSITDASGNYNGYPDTSGNTISYDGNGNMKDHIDKGVLKIDYNILNLPDYIEFDKLYVSREYSDLLFNVNTKHLYRADGTKLQKTYTSGSGKTNTETVTVTDYLDGFQYEGRYTGKRTAPVLKFVPTAEGYYNFENNKYIYSYTDHLGNVRLSYSKNTAGSAEVLEENNYYPFGLKHEGYNALTGNPAYNYEYNGKELQKETGWTDYGARMYMADIGRWGVIDPLAEQYRRFTPYNYAANNPIMFIDPDGRKIQAPGRNGESTMTQYQPAAGMISYLGAGDRASVSAFLGLGDGMGLFYFRTDGGGSPKTFGETQQYRDIMASLGNNPSPKPTFWQRAASFVGGLFGSNKGAGVTTILAGAEVSRIVQVGEIVRINAELFSATAGIIASRSVWALPLMLNGDSQFAANSKGIVDIPITMPVDISGEDVNRNGILLYRGVSSNANTKTQRIMYNEALFGIAIPNGLRLGNTAHWNMDDHAMGDNYSVWTSWTSNQNEASNFATNYGTAPGVILSKRFKVGVNAIPNVSKNGLLMQEAEWLIFGPVIRANVKHVKP